MKHIIINEPNPRCLSYQRPRTDINWLRLAAGVTIIYGSLFGACWLIYALYSYASTTLAAALRMGGV